MIIIDDIIEFFSRYLICCTDINTISSKEPPLIEEPEEYDIRDSDEEYYFVEA